MLKMKPRFALLATAGLVAAALSATAASTPAQALALSIDLRITNTLAPADPYFPNSRLSGAAQFTQAIPPPPLGEGYTYLPLGGPIAVNNIRPGDPYQPSDPYWPTDPYQPSAALLVSFTGTLSSTLGNFPAFFLPPNPIVPATPPSEAPAIDLGFLLNIGDMISRNGPVYAWDDPFEVGTWEVTITAVPDAIPEPATALLLMGTLGGFALTRRRTALVTRVE